MVFFTASSSNSDCGGPSNGLAVKVQSAVLGLKSESGSQMLCRRYLGLIPYVTSSVLFRAGEFTMSSLSTSFANMLVVTFIFRETTSNLSIEASADVFLGTFSCAGSFYCGLSLPVTLVLDSISMEDCFAEAVEAVEVGE